MPELGGPDIEPGDPIAVDGPVGDASPLDALLLPGRLGGPDTLPNSGAAVDLVRHSAHAGRPIGVICHGTWLLIEAAGLPGRTLTCVPQLSTDVTHAAPTRADADVHVAAGRFLLVSSDHDTAGEFADALVDQFAAARRWAGRCRRSRR